MKKGTKTALAVTGAALSATAAYLGVGGALCYSILSKRTCNKHPEELLYIPDNMRRYLRDENFRMADDWYNAENPDDTVLKNEKGETLLAKQILQDEPSHKWLIAVHGYSSRPRAVARQAIHFFKKGYNCIMPCQRAHRNQEAKFTSMGYYERYDIISWINYIVSADPDAEIVLLGISMGSATVMMVTGEVLPKNVKCCIADCGYSNCYDLFKEMISVQTGLPAFPFLNAANAFSSLFLGWNFKDCSPIDAVSVSDTPTLFIHGEDDKLVPFWMMEALYESCNAEKAKLACPGAAHDEACSNQPEMYWEAVDSFVNKYSAN